PRNSSSKRRKYILLGGVALIIVAAAVVVPLYFFVIKKHDDSASGSKNGTDSTSGGQKMLGAISGGDGSTVVTSTGESFVYNNSFGGYWLADAQNPFLSGAKPNSWTPALNESWNWGVDRIYGVNLGGWFVLEPCAHLARALQPYPSAPDEWTLAQLMRADGTLEATMEKHYDSFITEQDIAAIAGAGLNWVRVPIPFWSIRCVFLAFVLRSSLALPSTFELRPMLAGYGGYAILTRRGRTWMWSHNARASLRGSDAGRGAASGIVGADPAWCYDPASSRATATRATSPCLPPSSFARTDNSDARGLRRIRDTYRAFVSRSLGVGCTSSSSPLVFEETMLDARLFLGAVFLLLPLLPLDTHPYFAFDGATNNAPIVAGVDPANPGAGGQWPKQACSSWGPSLNKSRSAFGVTVTGEFRNGYNDCGLYLTGVNGTQHYGGDCSLWLDANTWNDTTKAGVKAFAFASMDATQDWFFWTWKIGPALDGVVRSPLWSYQLGLANGFMPSDPRDSIGVCAGLGVNKNPFPGTFSAWKTGGAGEGAINATSLATFGVWPPATLSNVQVAPTLLPTYTATATIPSLTFITPTATAATGSASGKGSADVAPTITASVGNGWFDAADQTPMVTAVAGCPYPFAWSAVSSPVPTVCTGTP
ncbi:glycoside hydrolase family 5 protein, partial [Mycena leptocephala]